jgi:hypothetical protein
LGTQLMTPEKAKAVWAIYVWCRRTDELVDGPNADRITPRVLFFNLSSILLLNDVFFNVSVPDSHHVHTRTSLTHTASSVENTCHCAWKM